MVRRFEHSAALEGGGRPRTSWAIFSRAIPDMRVRSLTEHGYHSLGVVEPFSIPTLVSIAFVVVQLKRTYER